MRGVVAEPATLECRLEYRPPLAWERLLTYLRQRAIPGVEHVDATHYRRTVQIDTHRGWLAISLAERSAALDLCLSPSLAPVAEEVSERVRNLCDLDVMPDALSAVLSRDPLLSPIVRRLPGLRVPGAFDGFELGVRAILGQQVSVRSATTTAGRWACSFGARLDTPYAALNRLAPTAHHMSQIDANQIAANGVVGSRARCIVALAGAIVDERVSLYRAADARAGDDADAEANPDPEAKPHAHVHAQIEALQRLPGIGPWTAQYIAMRALRWADAFPGTDLMLLRAARMTPKQLQLRAQAWRPWRAYATHYLWQSLA